MPDRTSTNRRRARLRLETSRSHQALDDLMQTSRMLADLQGYGTYLAASYLSRASVEARLDANSVANIYPVWPLHRIASLIEDDLKDLTAPIPVSDTDGTLLPMSVGAMFGALYVLEGSALGARVIASRVTGLGLGPSFGARHLARQAADGRAWPDFLSLLEEAPLTGEEEDDCVREAAATFECFLRRYASAA